MIHFKNNKDYFTVSNKFVDKFLCEANGSFVKVYLYALRHSQDSDATLASVANALNLLESDVIRAFKYWNKMHVIEFDQHSHDDFTINFISEFADAPDNDENESQNCQNSVKITNAPTAVNYTKSDINNYMENNDGIRHMFMISSQLLNKTLSDTDRKILFSFYDYLEMPVEVIFTLLEYCVSIGKTNMRYIEKVAFTWADKEINTLKKASAYVKEQTELDKTLNKYKEMFKITGRKFTDTEESFIKSWVYELKIDDNKIKQAYETTVTNTGKLAFKYMDAILKNPGFTSNNEKYNSENNSSKKKNAFQDYNGGFTDFDIEMMKRRINKANE